MKTSTADLRTLLHGVAPSAFWCDFYSITLADSTALYWVTNYPGTSVSWTSIALGTGAHTYSVAGVGAVPGIRRSGIKEKIGLEVDELKIDLLCGDATLIGSVRAEAAALAGTLDGASLTLERAYYADATLTEAGSVYRYSGTVTQVEAEAGKVTLTVSSPMAQLGRTLPRNFYTPLCGHALFDAGCALTKSNFTRQSTSGAVYSPDGIKVTEFRLTHSPAWPAYTGGIVNVLVDGLGVWACTFVSNAGSPIVTTYTLDQPQPVGSMPSGTFTADVEARCPKTIAACRDLFANLNRRRGFDFVPAPDSVTRNQGLKSYTNTSTVRPGGKGGNRTRVVAGRESRFEAQTSAYGRPIPIVLGTGRIGGNIILAGKYIKDQTDATSHATIPEGLVQLALCEGPIHSVLKCWIEQGVSDPVTKGWTIIVGDRTVTTDWSALSTHTDIRLRYSGTALVCDPTAWTQAATGELENATYAVRALLAVNVDPDYTTARDCDAGDAIAFMLNDPEVGLDLGVTVDASVTGGSDPASFHVFVGANYFHPSVVIVEEVETRAVIDQIMAATNSVPFFSEGMLKIRPLSMEQVSSAGGTYTPSAVPWYDLGARAVGADFMAGPNDPPVQVERLSNSERFNCIPIEYTARKSARIAADGTTLTEPNNEFRLATFDGDADPSDSMVRGIIKAPVLSLPCITREKHAKTLSRMLAAQPVGQVSAFRFTVPWRFALLEVGDLVTLTDASLGLVRELVRITEMTETNEGTFDVVAVGLGYKGTVPAATYTAA